MRQRRTSESLLAMNINPQPKRCYITAPNNPTDVLGEGTIQWSSLDGEFCVKMDDTGIATEYPSNMVVFAEDIERTLPFPCVGAPCPYAKTVAAEFNPARIPFWSCE